MKNFVQSGDVITVKAPAEVESGAFVKVGGLHGFAQSDAVSGENVPLVTRGVFETQIVAAGDVFAGDTVSWNVVDGLTEAGADNEEVQVGVVVSDAVAAVDGVAVVLVRI